MCLDLWLVDSKTNSKLVSRKGLKEQCLLKILLEKQKYSRDRVPERKGPHYSKNEKKARDPRKYIDKDYGVTHGHSFYPFKIGIGEPLLKWEVFE